MEEITLVQVPFQGGHIDAVQRMDGIWAGIRRMCEEIGVDYSSQLSKLKSSSWATMAMIATVAEDGKSREMSMLRADCIPMWMAAINPAKVSPELRPKLEAYQVRARDVLAAYFTPGFAHAAGTDVGEIARQMAQHASRIAAIEARRAEDHTRVGLLANQVESLKDRFKDFDDDHPNGLFGQKEARELRSLICQIRDIRMQLGDKGKPLTVFIQADNAVRTHVGYVRSSAASWEFATIAVGRDAKSFAARELEALRQKLQREQRKDKRRKREDQLDFGFDKAGKKRIRRVK
jgi:hypothetical protein